MSEENESQPVETVKYGTVGFSRKVTDGNYGHTEESIFLPFVVTPDDLTATIASAQAARDEAAGLVLNNLGLSFEFSEDGTLREVATKPVSAPVSVEQAAQSFGWATVSTSAPSGGGGIRILKRVNGHPDPDWLPAQVEAARRKEPNLGNEFWDNRSDSGGDPGGRKPWFKCKVTKVGIWPPKA